MRTLGFVRRRTFQVIAVTLVLAGIGVGSFFAVRTLTGGSGPASAENPPTAFPEPPGPNVTPAPGTTPDTSKPWWYVPYLNAERDKPLFDGTIAGVRIAYGEDPGNVCPDGKQTIGSYNDTIGTSLSLKPSYLPKGAEPESDAFVGLCDGKPAIAQATYLVSADPLVPRYGGSIVILRHRGKPVASLAIPRDRWHEGTVAGHHAAIAEPILPDLGLGESAVIVYSDGILTEVHADGIPMADVLKVAEGLF